MTKKRRRKSKRKFRREELTRSALQYPVYTNTNEGERHLAQLVVDYLAKYNFPAKVFRYYLFSNYTQGWEVLTNEEGVAFLWERFGVESWSGYPDRGLMIRYLYYTPKKEWR